MRAIRLRRSEMSKMVQHSGQTTRSPTTEPSLVDIAVRWVTGLPLSIRTTRHRALTPSPKEIATPLVENAAMSADIRAGQTASELSRTDISARPLEKTPSLWALRFKHRTM